MCVCACVHVCVFCDHDVLREARNVQCFDVVVLMFAMLIVEAVHSLCTHSLARQCFPLVDCFDWKNIPTYIFSSFFNIF